MSQIQMEFERVRILPDGRVPREDAARFLGRKAKTLADWSSRGIGPMPRKVGGRVFYLLQDLEAYRDTGARAAGSGVAA